MGILSKVKARYRKDKEAYLDINRQEKEAFSAEKAKLKEASRNKYYGQLHSIKIGGARRRAKFYNRFREPQNYFSTGRDIIGGFSAPQIFGGFDIITGKRYGNSRPKKRYKKRR